MDVKAAFKNNIELAHSVTQAYLSDMSDADLLVRPANGANHIAWQLGHLIASEHHMMTAIGHDMPALPDGFVTAHDKGTAESDDASAFLTKQQYLDLYDQVHKATVANIEKADPADFDKPAPESMASYAPTHGAVYGLIGGHEMMHVGQFATVRRKLGKPVVI